jgi:hypothetical protein
MSVFMFVGLSACMTVYERVCVRDRKRQTKDVFLPNSSVLCKTDFPIHLNVAIL